VALLNYDDIKALYCEVRRAVLKRAFEMHECTYRFFALGSDCALRLFAAQKTAAHEAAAAASNEIARIEARYSRYRSDSELSRINAAAKVGGTVEVGAETAGLIDYACACYRKSEGSFDITSGLLRKACLSASVVSAEYQWRAIRSGRGGRSIFGAEELNRPPSP
jgi:thiamine biosynthesis lipoprotein ApbE